MTDRELIDCVRRRIATLVEPLTWWPATALSLADRLEAWIRPRSAASAADLAHRVEALGDAFFFSSYSGWASILDDWRRKLEETARLEGFAQAPASAQDGPAASGQPTPSQASTGPQAGTEEAAEAPKTRSGCRLPPFSVRPACPKCHGRMVGVRFCRGQIAHSSDAEPTDAWCAGEFIGCKDREHLHRVCTSCGYEWLEEPADAQGGE